MSPRSRLARPLSLLAVLATLYLPAAPAEASSFVTIRVDDPPGFGFNDPTPYSGDATNPAATLGEARLRALEAAAAIWANQLDSPVEIEIAARFESLGGSPNGAVLGRGGPEEVYRDFAGAPLPGTWYPSALANKLAGMDLDGGTAPDIVVFFNAEVDGDHVLGSSRFDYGLDSKPSPGDLSFLEVALHEIGHGLGFVSHLDMTTGEKLLGYDDIYMRWAERVGATPPDLPSMTDAQRLDALRSGSELRWVGPAVTAASGSLTAGVDPQGRVELYAPSTISPLSTLHHFATAVEPDELMEPFWRQTVDLCLTLALFEDLGWGPAPSCVTPQDPNPPGLIFEDGFESGDVSQWSNSAGGP